MQPIEIIVIAAAVLFVALVTIGAIVRRKKGKSSCGCDCSSCGGCSACKERKEKKS